MQINIYNGINQPKYINKYINIDIHVINIFKSPRNESLAFITIKLNNYEYSDKNLYFVKFKYIYLNQYKYYSKLSPHIYELIRVLKNNYSKFEYILYNYVPDKYSFFYGWKIFILYKTSSILVSKYYKHTERYSIKNFNRYNYYHIMFYL